MRKLFILLAVMFGASIALGDDLKFWQPTLTYVSGSIDPTATVLTQPQGTFYFKDTGEIYLKGDDGPTLNWQEITSSGGGGSVTSVGMTVPSFLSVSGSPITTNGTLAVTLATQAANRVFAGPVSGGSAAPGFRSLVAADIPSLPYATSTGLVDTVQTSNGSGGLTAATGFTASASGISMQPSSGDIVMSPGSYPANKILFFRDLETAANITANAGNVSIGSTSGGNNGIFQSVNVARAQFWNNTSMMGKIDGGGSELEISAPQDINIHSTGADVKIQSLTYPSADGSSGDCMKTDGAGVLSFSACGGGGGSSVGSAGDVQLSDGSGGFTNTGNAHISGQLKIDGVLRNSASQLRADFDAGKLYNSGGIVDTVDFQNGKLKFSDGTPSYDWENGKIYAGFGLDNLSIWPSLRRLYANDGTTFNFSWVNPGELDFHDSSSVNVGPVHFHDTSDNFSVILQPPSTGMAADLTLTLPATDGTSGQVLQTDGAGHLSFVSAGGGSFAAQDLSNLTSPTSINQDLKFSASHVNPIIQPATASVENDLNLKGGNRSDGGVPGNVNVTAGVNTISGYGNFNVNSAEVQLRSTSSGHPVVKFFDNSANYVALTNPSSVVGVHTYALPPGGGAAGTFMTTDSSDNWSFTAASDIMFDSTNKSLLLGTTSQPSGTSSVPFYALETNATSANTFMYSERVFSDANGNGFAFRKARGTTGARTNVLNLDGLGAVTFNGYTAAGYGAGTVSMGAVATEDFNNTTTANRGSAFVLQTTPNGASGTRRNSMVVGAGNMRLYDSGGSNNINMTIPTGSNYTLSLPPSLPVTGWGLFTTGTGGSGNFSSLSGDAASTGAQGFVTVTGLQGTGVVNTAPSQHQIMQYSVGPLKWQPVTVSGDISATVTDGGFSVDKIKGTAVSSTPPTSGQVLTYNSTSTEWEAQTPAAFSNPVSNDTWLAWNKAVSGTQNVLKLDSSDHILLGEAGAHVFMGDASGTQENIHISPSSQSISMLARTYAQIDAPEFVLIADSPTLSAHMSFYDAVNGNPVNIKAPDTVAAPVTFELPGADGSSGDCLKTDASGHLSFGGCLSNPIANDNALQWLDNTATPFDVLKLNASNQVKLSSPAALFIGDFGTTTQLTFNANGQINFNTGNSSDFEIGVGTGGVYIFPESGSIAPPLLFATGDGAQSIGLKAPDVAGAGSPVFTLPSADGAADTVMTTDGSGHLSFAEPKPAAGTLCGWYDVGSTTLIASCKTHDPSVDCPSGYTQQTSSSLISCVAN